MKNKFNVKISRIYNSSSGDVFGLIMKGSLFRLSGADTIKFDFMEGGKFILEFRNRGIVDGTFKKIISGERIELTWNVTGFERNKETDTKVIISIEGNQKTTLTIEHFDINNAESLNAKKNSWTEILFDLDIELQNKEVLK